MRPIERLEQVAAEKLGPAAACSVNKEDRWWVARVWTDKGIEHAKAVADAKDDAIMTLVRELKAASA